MPTWAIILTSIVSGGVLGGGGIIAWFKLGPERKKITIEASDSAVLTISKVLKNTEESYDNATDEVAQLKMDIKMLEVERDKCNAVLAQCQTTRTVLEDEVQRHGRMAETASQLRDIARGRAHYAARTLTGYEIHIDHLLDKLRECKVHITPMMRTTVLRDAYHKEMKKFDEQEKPLITEIRETDPD